MKRREFLKGVASLSTLPLITSHCTPYLPRTEILNRTVWLCSDIHIGNTMEEGNGKKWLTDAINDINDHYPNIDYATVLGDLTEIGLKEEFDIFEQCLKKSYLDEWYFITGNHDVLNGSSSLEEFQHFTKQPLDYVLHDGNMVFIFLSDHGNSSLMVIEERRLSILQKILELYHENTNVILCTHHQVNDTIRGSTQAIRHIWPEEVIAKFCSDYSIDLWISGHYHLDPFNKEKDFIRKNNISFLNIASLSHLYNTNESCSTIMSFNDRDTHLLLTRRSHDTQKETDSFKVSLSHSINLSPENQRLIIPFDDFESL